ncbi:hypothetical protein NDU88_005463 [Pleurodeles waltl]|uniref:Uncharacterized protein n=1 Tax=Pleurodeles waltl TaxID=8319 RepID=A0AAV7QET4_PLEWA|nr:hypothetical protein NDU88_005463 [Pleurodeles waltl]
MSLRLCRAPAPIGAQPRHGPQVRPTFTSVLVLGSCRQLHRYQGSSCTRGVRAGNGAVQLYCRSRNGDVSWNVVLPRPGAAAPTSVPLKAASLDMSCLLIPDRLEVSALRAVCGFVLGFLNTVKLQISALPAPAL